MNQIRHRTHRKPGVGRGQPEGLLALGLAAILVVLTGAALLGLGGSGEALAQSAPAITIEANAPGMRVVVDGVVRATPFTLAADPSVTYHIYVPSPQTSDDRRTMNFTGWSDGAGQERVYTPTGEAILIANFETVTAEAPIFANGFEEGDTSAYPQENIDVAAGNSLEVTTTHPRTGDYSLEVSTGGTAMPSVIDQLFAKRRTLYQRTFVSLPAGFTLSPGAGQNLIVLKTDDFRNLLWVVIDSSYRLSPVYFNSEGVATFPGPFGPALPRDGSWHEIQTRHTIDEVHGQVELWLDGVKIAQFFEVNTGLPGPDDIAVTTWGSYFSTVSNVTTVFFDDITLSSTFITGESGGFQTETLVEGLNLPTKAVAVPDGRFFIAEKDGHIRAIKDGHLLPTPLVALPNVNTYGDRGLLSIALDPDFSSNGYLYAAYTHDVGNAYEGEKTARVIRLTVVGDQADLGTMQVILGSIVGDASNPSCNDFPIGTDCIPSDARTHTVADLQFMPDGTLLVSTGDGATDASVNDNAMRAQNLDILSGKVLRINRDGTAPPSNPFYTGNPNDNRSKVYAYGFRNPFRMGLQPVTGDLYLGDVGWGEWEELNRVTPGGNYGWPCYEGDDALLGYGAYEVCQTLVAAGTTIPPLYAYPHPPGSAVVGGEFYTGSAYPTTYQGAYFFGDYARSVIWSMFVNPDSSLNVESREVFTEHPDGPVDIFIGPGGDIHYLAIFNGELRRITYFTGGRPPVVAVSATPTSGPLPLSVQFSSTGTSDPDGGVLVYAWDFGDGGTSSQTNPAHTYTVAGNFTATLTVTDDQGISRSRSIVISAGNTAPEITITQPAAGTRYGVGETINFAASATDAEDGPLPDSSLSWRVILHHCETVTHTCHTHPFLDGSGAAGSFSGPDHGDETTLEIRFTATDSQGLVSAASVPIQPRLVSLTIESSPSNLTVSVNGRNVLTPVTVQVQENGVNSLFAPSPQILAGGGAYQFVSWSDGGAQSREFVTVTDATLTVTFEEISGQIVEWRSYDVNVQAGSPQAVIMDTAGAHQATLAFYQALPGNVAAGSSLNSFSPGPHTQSFNNLGAYWTLAGSPTTGYPYAGKSSVGRGSDVGETSPPAPLGALDLQLHPPSSDQVIVAALTVPLSGRAELGDVAARRVLGWGDTATLRVYGPSGSPLTQLVADSRVWRTNGGVYDLGNVSGGDRIYFAVDRDGAFSGDAIEIAWTLRVFTVAPTTIDSFTASPGTVTPGGSSTLSWATTNASSASIDQGIGPVAVNGSVAVSPAATTTYTLTVNGPGGSASRSVTVTVSDTINAPPVADDQTVATPAAMPVGVTLTATDPDGGPASLSYVVVSQPQHGSLSGAAPALTYTPDPCYVGPDSFTFRASDGADDSNLATVSVNIIPAVAGAAWRSYNIQLQSGAPQGRVMDDGGAQMACLEFYQSASAGGVAMGAALDSFRAGPHAQAFNDLSAYWTLTGSPTDGYPYAGKSSVGRGSGGGESGAPAPLGVSDLQLHPPSPSFLVVAAFVAPQAGQYTVSGLAARRVLSWGETSTLRVFGPAGTQVVSLQTGSQSWVTDSGVYNLGSMAPGDRIYFAVDRDGSFSGDAIEVAWTVTLLSSGPAINSFTASPATMAAGGSSTLSWETANATSVSINQGIGAVALDGSVVVTPAETTTYTLTATGPDGSVSAQATVTIAPSGGAVWHSHDVTLQAGAPQGVVNDESGATPATLEFYESADSGGVAPGVTLDSFRAGPHIQAFNNLSAYWMLAGSPTEGYPYAGKSSVGRGSGGGESGAPPPLGVSDLQLHPPANSHLMVAAFVAPTPGEYTISGLAARRVLSWGATGTLRVFGPSRIQVAQVQATSQAWASDSGVYNLGSLNAGDRIYIAVDRDGDFSGDAIEVAWTIELAPF